ncbi:MAG: S8 family serine peptidase, partial [Bacteroidia bacterium]|nr:S8 family serine peptidase [Bacteroidia bacterium]
PAKTKIADCSTIAEKTELSDDDVLKKQIAIMQGEQFIKEKITGKGIKIGVLDIGFGGYKKTKELKHLFTNGNIKATKNFASGGIELSTLKTHGTEVLSCIAGISDSVNMGLATEADFYLATYHRVSEMVEALEWFQDNGIQILNNSTKIDFSYYEKENLTGEDILASRAIAKAAKSGILVFSSAGNEGDNSWRSLVAPADAKGIISVGAISPETELRSDFSSLGPTFDKRLKPELCAIGETIVASEKKTSRENGTSFATPLLSGFAACALQLNPTLTKDQLYDHLLKSANLYPYFDYAHGYGVPKAGYFFKLKKAGDTLLRGEENFAFTKPEPKAVSPIEKTERNDTIFFYLKKGSLQAQKEDEKEYSRLFGSQILFMDEKMKREGKFYDKASLAEQKGKNYVYYHIADETGFLKKYSVILLETENIFYVTKKSLKPGYIIRVHYNGFTLEQKF